jgi:ferredoxin
MRSRSTWCRLGEVAGQPRSSYQGPLVQIERVTLAYFSPTGTTRSVLAPIAWGMGAGQVRHLDLTLPDAETRDLPPLDHLVLLGVPVYAGRVPETAARRLRRLEGGGSPAVLVVVYGNRAYEDALLELSDIARERGFVPIAAGAFIGEHSYSTAEMPIAAGRPDGADMGRAVAFGAGVRAEVSRLLSLVPAEGSTQPDAVEPPGPPESLRLPGSRPYRQGMRSSDIAPVTNADLCTRCGACAGACPVGAITVGERVLTDGWACILCCACIKACPAGARLMEDAGVRRTAQWLATEHGARKEPEIFIGE